MRIAGIILLVAGIVGLILFGMQAMNNSESFNLLGAEIAVSTANWTPVIISGVVTLIGLILTVAKKK